MRVIPSLVSASSVSRCSFILESDCISCFGGSCLMGCVLVVMV